MIQYIIEQPCNDPDYINLTITNQTLRCKNFTPTGSLFTTSFGITLCSSLFPAYSEMMQTLYVRGRDYQCDFNKVSIPIEDAPKVIMAIEEYNNKFCNNEWTI